MRWLVFIMVASCSSPHTGNVNDDVSRTTVIKVFLWAGQSNALGTGLASLLPASLTARNSGCLLYHTGDTGGGAEPIPINNLDFLQPGSGTKSALGQTGLTAPVLRFGPEITCGRDLIASLNTATTRIAIVKHCPGGTSLAVDWFPGGDATTTGDGAQYVTLQSTVTSAMAAMRAAYPNATVSIVGMFWVQGEADVASPASYETNLTNFIADVRLTYGASLPFVISGLSDYYSGANSDTIRTAQANVDSGDAYVSRVASTVAVYPMETSGDIAGHYTAAGYQTLGTALAAAMLPLL